MSALYLAATAVIIVAIASVPASHGVNYYGEHQFEQFCSKCHALPTERQLYDRWFEVKDTMLNYTRAFGATDQDREDIEKYIGAVAPGANTA